MPCRWSSSTWPLWLDFRLSKTTIILGGIFSCSAWNDAWSGYISLISSQNDKNLTTMPTGDNRSVGQLSSKWCTSLYLTYYVCHSLNLYSSSDICLTAWEMPRNYVKRSSRRHICLFPNCFSGKYTSLHNLLKISHTWEWTRHRNVHMLMISRSTSEYQIAQMLSGWFESDLYYNVRNHS